MYSKHKVGKRGKVDIMERNTSGRHARISSMGKHKVIVMVTD